MTVFPVAPEGVAVPSNWEALPLAQKEHLVCIYLHRFHLAAQGLAPFPAPTLVVHKVVEDVVEESVVVRKKARRKEKRPQEARRKEKRQAREVRREPKKESRPARNTALLQEESPAWWWAEGRTAGKVTLSIHSVPTSLRDALRPMVDALRQEGRVDELTGEPRFKHVGHQSGAGPKDKFWGWQVQIHKHGALRRVGLAHEAEVAALLAAAALVDERLLVHGNASKWISTMVERGDDGVVQWIIEDDVHLVEPKADAHRRGRTGGTRVAARLKRVAETGYVHFPAEMRRWSAAPSAEDPWLQSLFAELDAL